MGKQINFYIETELQEKFLQHCFCMGFIILAEDLKEKKLVKFNELKDINPDIYILYLYKNIFGDIIVDENFTYRLNYLQSPVIEFTRNLIKPQEKKITRGRLWMESKYYDQYSEVVYKDQKLIKEYNALVKWLKKHVKLLEVRNGDYIVKEYVTGTIKDMTNDGFILM
ncbi:hypothetical protein [Neobacillus dielmonensis]|uniref:hypothetical protein n=1 Tax=Neobacillus dielmonensis TaxID=1347369 RepID=UPI0005A73F92|nr:hypothetical protein [Neobacillus dielmonensis]